MPGSVVRQTRSSRVGTETLTETSRAPGGILQDVDVAPDSGPRVMIENGVRARPSSAMHARVSR